ncbi:MAG: hypothetical protein ACR2I1_10745 [Propionibacteriaceae bacterium]
MLIASFTGDVAFAGSSNRLRVTLLPGHGPRTTPVRERVGLRYLHPGYLG